MTVRHSRILSVFTALTIVATALVAAPAPAASALSGSEFNAGFIISDERFWDNGSMTEQQIQQFLGSQVPRCNSTDSSLPCLPSLVTSTSNRTASANGCGGYSSEGWESSARILWKIAQACRINAQVLIVMLQKEQGLITATKPTLYQYNAAMGANCPDTAPCAPTTLGFFNQVYTAAWQMRQYAYNPRAWRHQVGTTNVLFHPNSSCGSSPVQIQNQATANLYNYTPYQPNAAALANLYGTGDGCSSYGNRNFWRTFSTWFGSPTARGTTAIDSVYQSMGGAAGVLGQSTSDYISISTSSGSGTGRAYAGGSIYWSPRTGAAAVVEPFRGFYFGYDGANGKLGWPNSQSAAIPGRAGGAAQSFLLGSVYTSDATGMHSVVGTVRDHYFGFGGALGWLGFPTTEVRDFRNDGGPTPTSGIVQDFEGGTILSTSRTGMHAVPKAIYAAYNAFGGANSSLGWPTSIAARYEANGGGTGQALEGGSIYSSASGTYVVAGATRDVYFSAGGATGWMGWPTSDRNCQSDGRCWQHFQAASILSDAAGSRIALAAIEDLHIRSGGDSGPQGSRVSGLVRIPENGGGLGQVYANASIYFSSRGTFAVSGAIRSFYWSQNGASGALGFPTGAEECGDGTCRQAFAGGTVFWTSQDGAYVSSPAIAAVYAQTGGSRGPLGKPASWVVPIAENGGGTGQSFAGGSIYSSSRGTFVVQEPIRGGYFSQGGAAGALGFPVGGMTCDSGVCRQAFQSGTLQYQNGVGYSRG